MAEYITLLGAEQIQNAANHMKEASAEMIRAAGYLEAVLQRHEYKMEDWLARLEVLVENVLKESHR